MKLIHLRLGARDCHVLLHVRLTAERHTANWHDRSHGAVVDWESFFLVLGLFWFLVDDLSVQQNFLGEGIKAKSCLGSNEFLEESVHAHGQNQTTKLVLLLHLVHRHRLQQLVQRVVTWHLLYCELGWFLIFLPYLVLSLLVLHANWPIVIQWPVSKTR